jgi:hypothetical protein
LLINVDIKADGLSILNRVNCSCFSPDDSFLAVCCTLEQQNELFGVIRVFDITADHFTAEDCYTSRISTSDVIIGYQKVDVIANSSKFILS